MSESSDHPRVTLSTGETSEDITDSIREMYEFITNSMEWGSGFLGYDEELRWIELGHRLGFDVQREVANFRRILERFEETTTLEPGKTFFRDSRGTYSAEDIAAIRVRLDRFADDVTDFDERVGPSAEPTEAELAEMTVEQLNAYSDTFDE